MLVADLSIDHQKFSDATGWAIKPYGACKGDVCVPLPTELGNAARVDAAAVAARLGMAIVAHEARGLWAIGPETVSGRALSTAVAPDFELPRLDGSAFRLSSLRGKKVVMVCWGSWCGCRMDLPLWQSLRDKVHDRGIEIVTVALDSGGAKAARPWIERAAPEHPSLIDREHKLDALYGIVNVPNGVLIDENGMIVRPPEPAFLLDPAELVSGIMDSAEAIDPDIMAAYGHITAMKVDPKIYPDMIFDWIENGADSRFVLDPETVIARSQPRSLDESAAAAHFELGVHLHGEGAADEARAHFLEAHRLQPGNWTYKRQAWNLAGNVDGISDVEGYGTGWLSEVRKIGASQYYTPMAGTRG
jgi:peroxiredoxin